MAPTPEAALLARTIREAMKAQNMRGTDLIAAIARIDGGREPSEMQVSRWRNGEVPLVRVSPDLAVIAQALGLDPVELACDAIRNAHAPAAAAARQPQPPNPYQSPQCEHPNVAGVRCPACCDACNSDSHPCAGCGQPVGHGKLVCSDCRDLSEV